MAQTERSSGGSGFPDCPPEDDRFSPYFERPDVPARDYTLREREAKIYLACEDGASLGEIQRAFLDELVDLRLVYREKDRYLSLAIPATRDRR